MADEDGQLSASLNELIKTSYPDRLQVRALVDAGMPNDADNSARTIGYNSRRVKVELPRGAEAKQGDTLDLQPAWFLTEGARIRRAVAYVEVNIGNKFESGSGFLVSRDLFITNHHVIPDEATARSAVITFDRELTDQGGQAPTTAFRLNPDRFALFAGDNDLDFALIALGDRMSGDAAIDDLSYCILSDRPDKHVIGMSVNIIQHPDGMPKMIAVRNNLLTYRTDNSLLYETDTLEGSSGSPVFSDLWELIALHHWGAPDIALIDATAHPDPTEKVPNVNEGVRISSIYTRLQQTELPKLSGEKRQLLSDALAPGAETAAPGDGPRLSPPHAAQPSEARIITEDVPEMPNSPTDGGIRLSVPLEITIRLGSTGPTAVVVPVAPQQALPALVAPALRPPAAEKVEIDADYSNRRGYDPNFINGFPVPLPGLKPELGKQVTSLLPSQVDAAGGLLNYEHFSLRMNRTAAKKVAIFTATNISGDDYLVVDRATGKVTASEGDTWFKDPRISADAYLDQTFYGAWSTYFDRGHLTRRSDPTWGTPAEAERANADTFHFTNCSPQHFRFNEAAKYWQGAERYVLETGAIAKDTLNRVSVFQGPIYNDQIDLWADSVQIPSSFFKVIVWKGKAGRRSVALVVDQLKLLSEPRNGGLAPPKAVTSVNVQQWRVSVEDVEKRTGLIFDDEVRKADTFKLEIQPPVGEALEKITVRSLDDLLPDKVKGKTNPAS